MPKDTKTKTSTKGRTNSQDMHARKKAAVMGPSSRKGGYLLPAVIVVLLVAGAIGGYVVFQSKPDTPVAVAAGDIQKQVPSTADEEVTYPVAMFGDGRARHFNFQNKNQTIRYFIIKSKDGVIRAAFDACDVCWPSGKGYYQEDDHMVCRNCGRKFASVLVNEVKGGCNPAPLNRTVKGDKLMIKIEDILEGKQYFDFSGKA